MKKLINLINANAIISMLRFVIRDIILILSSIVPVEYRFNETGVTIYRGKSLFAKFTENRMYIVNELGKLVDCPVHSDKMKTLLYNAYTLVNAN